MSVTAEALAPAARSVRSRFPRFNRIDVGIRSRISLAKVLRRAEGEREVVISGRGSTKPEVRAYSSSRSSISASLELESGCFEEDGRDSSYFKSSLRDLSFATEESRGFPDAREAFNFARFSAIDASRRRRALL